MQFPEDFVDLDLRLTKDPPIRVPQDCDSLQRAVLRSNRGGYILLADGEHRLDEGMVRRGSEGAGVRRRKGERQQCHCSMGCRLDLTL